MKVKKAPREKIEAKDLEISTLKAQLARTLADYDNLQKRVERDRENLIRLASIGIVSQLISILDSLEVAQNHLMDPGLALVVTELTGILKDNDLEEIRAVVGEEFNENHHEAVESIESKEDNLKGKIAELVLKGWKFKEGQIVRHAKVKVYAK